MSADLLVRQLTAADAAAYRDLRLEALQNAPTAFGSNYEAESKQTVADFEGWMTRSYIAGAWLADELVGSASFYRLDSAKAAHRGNIWGVYVRPAARGHGVARAVMENVLAFARTQVQQVHLAVVTGNGSALKLYEHLGFTTYGIEPRALCVDGRYYDENLMVLRFD
jgi:ribosomal protein S18 acetylase RimI-like enzyme